MMNNLPEYVSITTDEMSRTAVIEVKTFPHVRIPLESLNIIDYKIAQRGVIQILDHVSKDLGLLLIDNQTHQSVKDRNDRLEKENIRLQKRIHELEQKIADIFLDSYEQSINQH